ncbi:type-4 ice-structuring protein LS-12 isoform X2 [Betta splendens]|uniref:Type-4 ice-structuring protein LS-12 isoform X2 n=1 Tax=Betta splendens TaxID=158456 RepID=A0A8M1H5X5_BETSP|nr:type-4 ice-structuring protein LS-12 isoform X2 [Betta splendens]XP_040923832.1 type-4 ice-structuring protein LS-12 isoform X2 [Betta splendens]
MKFSLVAALVVVLAVARAEAAALVKRDAQFDMDKFISEMSASFTSATEEIVEKMKSFDMSNAAQTYVEDGKAQIQPLVEKVQAEAAKLQQQVKPFVTNIEGQVKPLTDVMEKFLQQAMAQAKSLLPPQ